MELGCTGCWISHSSTSSETANASASRTKIPPRGETWSHGTQEHLEGSVHNIGKLPHAFADLSTHTAENGVDWSSGFLGLLFIDES
ncbi:predicted protein [Uncinocarpus reesii 1704]|uniref:Uncharacterized protein n=1 Tax=Uncinocarpus reesii (strain UAMH 1704) TaxID=336963 RepID=C4JP47_UNCRE|nr:uncharacterized protein UREG_03106 [Uncinocarpus reesii 1704]EEP78261.1 predicted protein [Uncinocarpus reesii 1704]